MTETQPAPPELRDRLAIALDVDDIVEARQLARDVAPWFGVAKVGLELYSAAGPAVVAKLIGLDFKIFLDLKLHDIPTTVERAARVVGSLGVSYLTIHAMGGAAMLRSAVEGLTEGASRAGLPEPTALAVTILTSDSGAPPHIFGKRVQAALEGGCGGIVCAASDVRTAKQLAPRMITVVPGLRPAGAATHDQTRAATPQAAFASGADLLVIGRAVTGASDRAAAAAEIVASLA